MTVEEIQTTIQEYVHAARMAKEAGFDGVEVNAAGGYLLDTITKEAWKIAYASWRKS
jgi:N-ethylmaleimide reductase